MDRTWLNGRALEVDAGGLGIGLEIVKGHGPGDLLVERHSWLLAPHHTSAAGSWHFERGLPSSVVCLQSRDRDGLGAGVGLSKVEAGRGLHLSNQIARSVPAPNSR
jgi:hypothetical protein